MSRVGAEPFSYRRTGRNRTAIVVVSSVWSVLLAAILLVDAAPWLMAIIGAFTLPTVWELFTNPTSGLELDDTGINWFTGRRRAALNRAEIDRFRFDTRLDFSVRASAILRSGQKVRLPYECTPPHQLFEAALNAHNIRVERHHFSLVG